MPELLPALVIGAGQAGLSASYYLQRAGLAHVVLERHTSLHVWQSERWDSFSLVTPNWQCRLPGWAYHGTEPHGFMTKPELNAYLHGFAKFVRAPVIERCEVLRLRASGAGFEAITAQGPLRARQVIVAVGAYHLPQIPAWAHTLPAHIAQLSATQYRNPEQLPPGAILVVGSGQSGAQIAEDLHLTGRQVHLAVGRAPRCARFYRGRDVVDWLSDMGHYTLPVEAQPEGLAARDKTNHYVTGRAGGHDIDLRQFAREGMRLYGPLTGSAGPILQFAPELKRNLDSADATYNKINQRIDAYIEASGLHAPPASRYWPVWEPEAEETTLDLTALGISAIIWCAGFAPAFDWLEFDVLDATGLPRHQRGVTPVPGLYVLGLPWLHSWGSARFFGVAADAEYVVERLAERARPAALSVGHC